MRMTGRSTSVSVETFKIDFCLQPLEPDGLVVQRPLLPRLGHFHVDRNYVRGVERRIGDGLLLS